MDWTIMIIAILIGLSVGLWIVMRREAKKCVVSLSEQEFIENMRKGQLVDIRSKEAFEAGHINGARHIPFAVLTRQPGKLRSDLPIYLYDDKGKQTRRAALMLSGKGYNNLFQLEGGLENWTGPLKASKK
ncbi:MAG TPA: rhodanese-like domain-containing protein [Firmicutes bacterium]|nr:rhodanese-like domain-containing protein [Bacillota bacterium]